MKFNIRNTQMKPDKCFHKSNFWFIYIINTYWETNTQKPILED